MSQFRDNQHSVMIQSKYIHDIIILLFDDDEYILIKKQSGD